MLLKKIIHYIRVFFCIFFVMGTLTLKSTPAIDPYIMFPLERETQRILFPEIIAPINFMFLAPEHGILPLNNQIKIDPNSSYLVLDVNNTLIMINEFLVDQILKIIGLEKKIIGQCTAQELLAAQAKLYHPNAQNLMPLIADNEQQYSNPCDISIEKKIVIIITSFNNKDWYKKNLDSVFMQKYTNYRIIYIDDRSPDGTGQLVQAYIKEKGQESRTTLVLNSEWKSQMANHYLAVYMCDDDEICCHLDGDDWLIDEDVLNTINQIYLKKDIWITYGLPLDSLGGRPPRASQEIMEKVIRKNTYRTEGCWAFSHMRTFYAWLFKSLKLQDLVYRGNFANMSPAPDVAMMYPMLEMAGLHTHLVDRDLYIVNKKNPISQCNITPYQVISELDRTIKGTWPAYEPLFCPMVNRINNYENQNADIIIWTESFSLSFCACLQAMKRHLTNFNAMYVIYESNNIQPKDLEKIRNQFPDCNFIEYNANTTHFKALLHYLMNITNNYLIFASSDFILEQDRDISLCIKQLERTFAYGFYFHLQYYSDLKNICAPLWDDLIAWQPEYTKNIWETPNALGMALYRKKDIENTLKNIHCSTISQFTKIWGTQKLPERTVGLFFR